MLKQQIRNAAVVALLLQLSLTDGVVPSSLKIFKRDKWDYGVATGPLSQLQQVR